MYIYWFSPESGYRRRRQRQRCWQRRIPEGHKTTLSAPVYTIANYPITLATLMTVIL